jgi:biotin carboxylase
MARCDAFILFGGLSVLVRHPLLFSALAERGLRTLVVTDPHAADRFRARMADPQHPLSLVSDVAFFSSDDHLGILDQTRAWAARHSIHGVHCVGELNVEAAGLVADLLGVRFPGLRAVRVCRNKYLQRQYLGEWSPPARLVRPAERDALADTFSDYPAVLKPITRFSSSGVQLIQDRAELRERLGDYPAEEPLLLEARIEGREVSVESIVQDGQVVFESITEKRTNEGDTRFFTEMAHTLPAASLSQAEQDRLLAVNRAVLRRLAFADGIAHPEFRVTSSGQVYLMEIAARGAGDGIFALHHLATGRPLEPELVKLALGEPVAYPKPGRWARQVYVEHAPGRLHDVSLDGPGIVRAWWCADRDLWPIPLPGRAGDPGGVRELLVLKQRGDELGGISDSFDRAVTFLIDGRTPRELDVLEADVRAAIRVQTAAPVSPTASAG